MMGTRSGRIPLTPPPYVRSTAGVTLACTDSEALIGWKLVSSNADAGDGVWNVYRAPLDIERGLLVIRAWAAHKLPSRVVYVSVAPAMSSKSDAI